MLLFPHQLKVVDSSDLKVTVKNNFFKGSHYLVESEFDNQIVFLKAKRKYH
jgi:hypothetical protein